MPTFSSGPNRLSSYVDRFSLLLIGVENNKGYKKFAMQN